MSLFPSLDDIEDNEEPKINSKGLNITFSTIEYTYGTFANKLLDGSMSDYQIQQDICNHYDRYCNYDNFQNPSLRDAFIKIWTNKTFLGNFNTILLQNKKMKEAIKLYNRFICKITYDYYSEKVAPTNAEDEICNLLFTIVNTLNESKIIPITNYMYNAHALFVVLAANSSFDYSECINRVNYFIVKGLQYLDITQIVDLYGKVFGNLRFTVIFTTVMSDVPKDLDTYNPAELSMYHKITSAILVILNSITSIEIKKVINGYDNYLRINGNIPQRINLEDKLEEYPRIAEVYKTIHMDD